MTARVFTDPLLSSPGFFRVRLVRGGPFVPARLWTVEHRDAETGELIADIEFFAELNGEPVDPELPPRWPWHPIEEAEFRLLVDQAAWDRRYDPRSPLANPTQPIDRATAPLF